MQKCGNYSIMYVPSKKKKKEKKDPVSKQIYHILLIREN